MNNYYNFQASEYEISYEPYLYDKTHTLVWNLIGLGVLIGGIVLSFVLHVWELVGVGVFFGSLILIRGLYHWLIKDKTKLVFDKHSNALYKITPLGKTALIALSNVYDIITVSEYGTFTYDLTNKARASAKSIPITPAMTAKDQRKQRGEFLETEIIPAVEAFLNLNPTIQQTRVGNTHFTSGRI